MYDLMPPTITPQKKRFGWLRRPMVVIPLALAIILLGLVGGAFWVNHWYTNALKPLSQTEQRMRVTVPKGADAAQIGKILQDKQIIRNARAFEQYVSRSHNKSNLQAGTYLLSPSFSVQKIVDMLAGGEVDAYNLTLTPGKYLDQISASLVKAGFDQTELQTALAKKYDHPLFADKPANADLEGYIFPDTYHLDSQANAEKFLTTTFDTFWKHIQDEGIVDKLKAHGLTLYQGITLASIVQKEVSNPEDQKIVAQVFLSRLQKSISLGSDVTYMYASHKAGVADNITIDSPYNTRLHKGLPPGPIANFNMSALEAVANPSPTDYLFFVAGDDGKVYYSHTHEEHEALTKQYCTKLCQE